MSELLLERGEWCARCARRVRAIDPALSQAEALEIARDFNAFERTAKMEPEAAADFVHLEMGRADVPRFERRVGSAAHRSVISQFLERISPPAEHSRHG